MLLSMGQGPKPPRLAVFAYDMASPRRARQVRRLLASVHHAKQYSVFETLVHSGEFRGLLAELTAVCDLSRDKLAVWWPRRGVRVQWQRHGLRCVACAAPNDVAAEPTASLKGAGNFVICYDVSDPEALNAVAGHVAAASAMVQRSVYWLRASPQHLQVLFERCGRHLADNDHLWAYPLRGAQDLWHVDAGNPSVLPMAADRWWGRQQR